MRIGFDNEKYITNSKTTSWVSMYVVSQPLNKDISFTSDL